MANVYFLRFHVTSLIFSHADILSDSTVILEEKKRAILATGASKMLIA
jgi:hypothetical protein